MANSMKRTYLGDGVYAKFDEWGDLVLTTSDGIRDTNLIVLEPDVLAALEQFIMRQRESAAPAIPQEP